jgi:hypothetical protein
MSEPIRLPVPSVRIVTGTATITCACGALLYLEDMTERTQCDRCGQFWEVRARIRPLPAHEGERRRTAGPAA